MAVEQSPLRRKRRIYGEHLTPIDVFHRYIAPEIKGILYKHVWVDLFAGKGNLVLPILDLIPKAERVRFFRERIFLFDIQEEMVEAAIENAANYGIPRHVAEKNIMVRDTLMDYPTFLSSLGRPVYHITNPPYLYIGYIVKIAKRNTGGTRGPDYLRYFEGPNKGYQDLYQIALINDLRHGIPRMTYIIPSNFLFGYSVSNKIRRDLLRHYTIRKAVIVEKGIFEHTGTNVAIVFFERKRRPRHEPLVFPGLKIGIDGRERSRTYYLHPRNNYRAGGEFDEFLEKYRSTRPLKISFYLTQAEVEENHGIHPVSVIDVNDYDGRQYRRKVIYVNKRLHDKIKSNILFVRTVDTGSREGRAGLYVVREVFDVDGILVSKAKYRTHPVQLFIEPTLPRSDQLLLREYFNAILEYFREKTDSEFLTTYKYSNSEYTRKYLGLSQARKLIQTFPLLEMSPEEKDEFKRVVRSGKPERIIGYLARRTGNDRDAQPP